MSTCPRQSVTAINISPRARSRICAAPAITPASRRSMSRSAATSPTSSTGRTATGSAMFNFEQQLADLSRQTVLCVGDLMLDDFVYGDVSRISPEAPVPVIAVRRSELVVGGAGNVARNIAALGAHCLFVGMIGDDEAGRTLRSAIAKEPLIAPTLVVDGTRPTTRKIRFVSEHHSTHLLRADWEQAETVGAATEKELIARALAGLDKADAVVLSDYTKGVLTRPLIRQVIDAARRLGKPVVVDPKGKDFGIYRGATLITPNLQEL